MERKILVPIVTPFNDDETVNYEALAQLTKKLIADGADGIYAVGSSAECWLLSTEERKKCLEVIVEAAGDALVVAHIGAIGTKNTIDLAKHAEKVGANGISSVPPFYFGYGEKGVYNYYKDVSESVNIPMLVYNIPSSSGVKLSIAELVEIMALPNVDSLKFTDSDYYVMEQIHTDSGKFIYSGKDECFLSAIAAGADGGIGTTYNFMIDKYIRIWNEYKAGNVEKALEIQKSANKITRAVIEAGTLPATKYILELQGIKAGKARKPFAELSEEAKKHVKEVYERYINI